MRSGWNLRDVGAWGSEEHGIGEVGRGAGTPRIRAARGSSSPQALSPLALSLLWPSLSSGSSSFSSEGSRRSWARFLGDESASAGELLIEYPKFLESIQSYVEAGTNQANKYSHLKAFLKDYVSELGLVDDPGAILARDIPFNERVYEAFVHATGDTQKKSRHNICSKFFDWVLEIYCSDEDDEGELIVLPGYRNPLRTVLKGLLDQLPSPRRSESSKPPLPMDAILRAKQHLIPPEATSFRDTTTS